MKHETKNTAKIKHGSIGKQRGIGSA